MIWPIGSNKEIGKKIRTFTYYIPAPPTRRSGYREKEFDKLMAEIIEAGFNIKSLTTQAHNGEKSSGMWIICQLSGDKSLDWSKLDKLADPLPREREEYRSALNSQGELIESDKEVELPAMSEEEAQQQLENLYPIDHEGKKS